MVLTFREILQAVGEAICSELVRLISERGRQPLRTNSALAKQLLSSEAVQVQQQRASNGRFGTYGLTIVALDYLQWIDTGRRPGAKKVPILAIIQFIKDRNLKLRDKKTGRFAGKRITLKGRNGAPDVSTNQLAFMIQNAIYKNGIAGRHMLADAWATGELLLDKLLSESALDNMTADLDRQFQYLATA